MAMALPLVYFLVAENWAATLDFQPGQSLAGRWANFKMAVAGIESTYKLLAFGLYMALCCTFLPLPTSWIVAAVALPAQAVGGNIWTTILLVTAVGSVASVVANLNDYHLFTLMLRHHHIAKVRNNRTYRIASRWFTRSPFLWLVIFNFIPIPVDIVRLLATSYRYPRLLFATSNFIGRAIRYAVIACVTYSLRDKGWVAVVVLLALGVALGIERMFAVLAREIHIRRRHGKAAKCSAG